ncbi:MAG: FAD-dependent oxidoreductase [Bacteroidales bacterium]|jgi:NADPH-dependent 2,4-dienoyl-CoA reductase/sulfur reductase-like enzyme/peroxiredoxin family protein/rhodanese-related sulfurtransferase/TusA-related sulfurtransferase|nr:FAD-dependent oxidoreductase [Bacteroidales bacterium]MDY0054445.1 FAD-dependent oxidoreductase [Bacteroidales bacterium]
MKHVIVGGVAGGATAAARIRRIDESAEIILLEKGKHISYANCGLPYYIGGEIEDREKLFLQTPQSFGTRFKVDVRVENEVVSIDKDKKEVLIRRGDSSTYTESYDRLLLSPGASPVRPPIKGIDSEGIFTLRNVTDTDKIKHYITSRKIQNAVVVGAGFIGLEMAENLHHAGAEVTIVEMNNQVMTPVDFSMAAHVHQHLIQKNINLYLEIGAERFERRGDKIDVYLTNKEIITTDIVILSIGVRPDIQLAKTTDIKLGETGGIWVDEYLQTSVKDIYAVGDAIEFPHPITGKPWLNYLANPANRQGRIVADNMVFGNKYKYEGAIGTSIAKVFDMTVASTGLAGKKLKQLGIPYISSTTHSNSHAGYYPNALPLSIKLMFSPEDGRILGASVVGYDGVDKRIDQIALLIKKQGTINDLIELEHAYAPPYSSAKDPIAIAGYVASNILNGIMPIITWRDISHLARETSVLIDVRTKSEYEMGTIRGALNIPVDELRERLDEIPKNKDIIIFCQIGLRGYLAHKILTQNGFKNVKNLSGGYKTYSIATAPISHIEPKIIKDGKAELDEQNTKVEIKTMKINACGLQCPGPILKLKNAVDEVSVGQRIEISSTDAGFARDAQAWCNSTGNELISSEAEKGIYTITIEKGAKNCSIVKTSCDDKGKTIIVFSDDLDKALATMVLANGAAATGEKVTLFFTFWGLNVIKKVNKPKVDKDIFGKMFSMMLPSHSKKLSLSKMSMLGAGDKMMRHIMKKRNIESLEALTAQALANGVEFIACQMSMDVMGVNKEELIDEVTIGGVATYMERADNANVNLFI